MKGHPPSRGTALAASRPSQRREAHEIVDLENRTGHSRRAAVLLDKLLELVAKLSPCRDGSPVWTRVTRQFFRVTANFETPDALPGPLRINPNAAARRRAAGLLDRSDAHEPHAKPAAVLRSSAAIGIAPAGRHLGLLVRCQCYGESVAARKHRPGTKPPRLVRCRSPG